MEVFKEMVASVMGHNEMGCVFTVTANLKLHLKKAILDLIDLVKAGRYPN